MLNVLFGFLAVFGVPVAFAKKNRQAPGLPVLMLHSVQVLYFLQDSGRIPG